MIDIEVKIKCMQCKKYFEDHMLICSECDTFKVEKYNEELFTDLLDFLIDGKEIAIDGETWQGFNSYEEKKKLISYFKSGYEWCMYHIFEYADEFRGGTESIYKKFKELEEKFKDEIIDSELTGDDIKK